jgi:cell division protein FtsN
MPRRKEASLSILSMLIILAAIMVTTLTDFAKFGVAQGQSNGTSSLSLTPEQKDAICNPNNPESKLNPVNTTESKICGIPKTVKPSNTTTSTTPDTTTGAEAPPSLPDTSIAPPAVP